MCLIVGLTLISRGAGLGATPVTLKVKEVIKKPSTPLDTGLAVVRLQILDGPYRGKSFRYEHHLWGNPQYDPAFRNNAIFVGKVTVKNGKIQRLELGQERKHYTLLFLFLVLTLVLVGLAGWEGFIGLICSLVTLLLILYGLFPVALSAGGILFAGVALCLLTVAFTIPLVLKGTPPSVPALVSLTAS